MKFNVTEVEFDFDDDYAEESKLTFDEEIEIRDLALGVWDADDEDVGRLCQLVQNALAFGRLEVDGKSLLVAVD